MIAILIQLWPRGDQSKSREIGRMYVANNGGTADRGDYLVGVCRRGTVEVPTEIYAGHPEGKDKPRAARAGLVTDYPRLAYNVWRLISRAIVSAFPEEAPAPKKRVAVPVIGADVMRGLVEIANHYEFCGPEIPRDKMSPDLQATFDWLAEAKLDPAINPNLVPEPA